MIEHTRTQTGARAETLCVHAAGGPDPATGAVVPPLAQTSTFAFPDAATAAARFNGAEDGPIYSRLSNPTVAAFEHAMAALEGAEAGVAFASGMSAIASTLITLVRPGERVVASRTLYGGTLALLDGTLARLGLRTTYVDGHDLDARDRAIDDRTRALYVETPANPTLALVDLEAWAERARARRIPLVVDNTFATPCLQRPLDLGADVVLHSATKYVGGHADALGGVVVAASALATELRQRGLAELGAAMSPFNAWLLLRGLRTLPLRMERHAANALAVARFLERHPAVARVRYPGLPSHPQYALALRQMRAGGGMVSFELAGGDPRRVLDAVRLITLAVSLGDTATLIEHPATMTHHGRPPQELAALGIAPGLIRLSVGLEHVDDIVEDLGRALACA
jgi:methionine-gamma-lyase